MSKTTLSVLMSAVLVLTACGGSKPEPQRIQAIPDNPADMDTAGIESQEIAPGLTSKIILRGEGPVAEVGHTAVVHYTGWLYDETADKNRGAKFDSSVDRGAHFRFPIGAGRVIAGWDQGVVGMRVGEVRELTIAPELGYGDRGVGPIPPGATLVFVIELADLEGLGMDDERDGEL
jgi:FKBP-type peptidyl-prolyl cis-trans isomerase FkpA